MDQWPKDVLFLVTGLLAGLAGLAAEARANRMLTVYGAMSAVFFYGLLGSALGMISYQWFGGKEHPQMIIAGGMMVGLRIISPLSIKQIVARILGIEWKDKNDDDSKKNDAGGRAV